MEKNTLVKYKFSMAELLERLGIKGKVDDITLDYNEKSRYQIDSFTIDVLEEGNEKENK